MEDRKVTLTPNQHKNLKILGQNIKLARLRRKLSSKQVAQRANIARLTLVRIEKGDPTVRMGHYVQILFVLGLGSDLGNVALDDELGRKLQDAEIDVKKRAPKR